MQKDWFAIFKVKIIVRAHNSNQTRTVSTTRWTADPFTTKLSLMGYCCKLECIEKTLGCWVKGQGHSKDLNFQ